MVDVLPERNTRTAELHRNADIVQPPGEHISAAQHHGARSLGGPGSGLGPDGHIGREKQLRRLVTLDGTDDRTISTERPRHSVASRLNKYYISIIIIISRKKQKNDYYKYIITIITIIITVSDVKLLLF